MEDNFKNHFSVQIFHFKIYCQQGDELEDNPSTRLSNNCNLLSLNYNLLCIALNINYVHFSLCSSVPKDFSINSKEAIFKIMVSKYQHPEIWSSGSPGT